MEVTLQPVGKFPEGDPSRDRSIHGVGDLLGNAREYSSTKFKEDGLYLFGTSAAHPYGPTCRPSYLGITYISKRASADGAFRLLIDLDSLALEKK